MQGRQLVLLPYKRDSGWMDFPALWTCSAPFVHTAAPLCSPTPFAPPPPSTHIVFVPQTIDKILKWVKDDGDIEGKTICDCGCGVGSLAIPLAQMGAKVSASDISDAMSTEAGRRAKVSERRNGRQHFEPVLLNLSF